MFIKEPKMLFCFCLKYLEGNLEVKNVTLCQVLFPHSNDTFVFSANVQCLLLSVSISLYFLKLFHTPLSLQVENTNCTLVHVFVFKR